MPKAPRPRKRPPTKAEIRAHHKRVDAALKNPEFDHIEIENFWGPFKRKGRTVTQGGFRIGWAAKHIGGGEFVVCAERGKLRVDDEMMGRTFVTQAFRALLEKAVLESDKRGKRLP